MSDRVYVGKGKRVGKFGNIKLGLKLEGVNPNEKGYTNLIVSEMREPDKYGNEFTVYVDDYQPIGGNRVREPIQDIGQSEPIPDDSPF